MWRFDSSKRRHWVVAKRRSKDKSLVLLALLAVNAVSTLAFLFYAAVGIDTLEQYVGYFYWSAPLVMVLIIAVAAVQSLSLRLGTVVAVAAAVAVSVMPYPSITGTPHA